MSEGSVPTALTMEYWPIARLVPYVRNPRKNDKAVAQMVECIQEFGFRIPVLAKSDGSLVDGHLRLKAALRMGLETIPVLLADDLTDAQIKAFRLTVNRSATWADWDYDLVSLELAELRSLGVDLEMTGFDRKELTSLAPLQPITGLTDPDDVPEPPAVPVSRLGDVWVLGQHRLLCGDSLDRAAVEVLMVGGRAAMTFTDPPYNVDYGNSSKDKQRGNDRRILNDDLGDAFGPFLLGACRNILEFTDGAVYICMSSSELDRLQRHFREAGGHWSTFIVWAKDQFTLGRSDYQRQYEPILYGWREGATRYWCGARDQSDLWPCARPRVNDLHPTMKPVELVERALAASCRPGDVVLDLFGGGGSTLIASERLQRQARLMELDPAYCDVIVNRWQAFSGREAVLEGDGTTFATVAGHRRTEV